MPVNLDSAPSASSKGFGKTVRWADAPFVAEPSDDAAAAWQTLMEAEAAAAAAQGVRLPLMLLAQLAHALGADSLQ